MHGGSRPLVCGLAILLSPLTSDAVQRPAHEANGALPPAHDACVIAADFQRSAMDGTLVHLADWRGKVVLLNFWATWCAPCLVEMPRFSAWQRRYASQGLQVLGVSMDDSTEPVRRLLSQGNVSFPVIMGDTKLAKLYGGIYGLPSTFLIDRSGRIVGRFRGEVDLKDLEGSIQALLAHPTH